MKKNILRVFSLFAILILVCTMVSRFVEDWMTPRVILTETEVDLAGNARILADAIREDENGTMALGIVEKVGVDAGQVAERCQAAVYGFEGDYADVNLYGGQQYVLYTTKDIVSGHKVVRLKDIQAIEDEYLLIFAEDAEVSNEVLEGCGFTDVQIESGCALIHCADASAPFVPEELFSKLRKGGIEVEQAYSLYEAEQFKTALSKLAAACGIILVLFALWGVLCRVIARPTKLKVTVVLLLITAGFVGLYLMLKAVYLPSSLLPERHIFDIQHYKTVFRTIEKALALLG